MGNSGTASLDSIGFIWYNFAPGQNEQNKAVCTHQWGISYRLNGRV